MTGVGQRRCDVGERPVEEISFDAFARELGSPVVVAAGPGDHPAFRAQASHQAERAIAEAEAKEPPAHSALSVAASRRSATTGWRSRAHSQ